MVNCEITSYLDIQLSKENNIILELHSAFKNILNFSNENLLISLTTSNIPVSPFSIRILENQIYQKISNNIKSIKLNINYPDMFISSREKNNFILYPIKIIDTNINILPLPNQITIRKLESLINPQIILNDWSGNKIEYNLTQLQFAISNDSIKLMRQSIKNLIGLGSGLTPIGDDIIYGLYNSSRVYNLHNILCKEIEYLIKSKKELFSFFSYHFLSNSSAGYIYKPLKDLFIILSNNKIPYRLIDKIKQFGATSGIALLIVGLRISEQRNRHGLTWF